MHPIEGKVAHPKTKNCVSGRLNFVFETLEVNRKFSSDQAEHLRTTILADTVDRFSCILKFKLAVRLREQRNFHDHVFFPLGLIIKLNFNTLEVAY